MSHRTQEEDFEDLPVRRKQVKERDTQAALEARVRLEVLQTSEDWITDKFIAACVGAGTKHIGTILQKMTKEGVLSELTSVPMVEADDPQVKMGNLCRRPRSVDRDSQQATERRRGQKCSYFRFASDS